jgi:hypothetical protein
VKPKHPYGAVATRCVVFFALLACMHAQEATPARHQGVPQDWSQGHIVFTRDGLVQHPDLIYREPRVLHQAMQRWQAPNSDVFRGRSPVESVSTPGHKRDWSFNFIAGRLSPNMFPVKFSFDPAAPPDCTNDFVVFGLAAAGTTGGHPNLVGFNNLYVNSSGTGFCPGTAPNVMFAYNITTATGGKIVTSPIVSLDGKKIGFVESVGTSAIFHVLTWTAGQGTRTAAAAPVGMTSLTFSPANNSTTSSPYIDYSNDIAYLGADSGKVYKITGVFRGTPALAGGVWPVTLSTNFHLTPPVLDTLRGLLMVGSANGNLYQIKISSGSIGTLVVGKSGVTNPGVAAPPIVDVTNGTTFVISADDGTSAVLVEADTTSMTLLSKARIGLGAAGGTALNIFEPAFDNNYYNNPSTGQIHTCGTGAADTTPWEYSFGFTGRNMKTVATFSQQIPTIPAASTAARCTSMTEFFNPNIGVGGTDYFFFGLTQDCTAAGGTGGCVMSLTGNNTFVTATVTGGPSGIIADNYSAAAEAHSIYLSARNVDTAYKFTQNGLQ